eukprot:2072026-Prymnesium_polylepis.1
MTPANAYIPCARCLGMPPVCSKDGRAPHPRHFARRKVCRAIFALSSWEPLEVYYLRLSSAIAGGWPTFESSRGKATSRC